MQQSNFVQVVPELAAAAVVVDIEIDNHCATGIGTYVKSPLIPLIVPRAGHLLHSSQIAIVFVEQQHLPIVASIAVSARPFPPTQKQLLATRRHTDCLIGRGISIACEYDSVGQTQLGGPTARVDWAGHYPPRIGPAIAPGRATGILKATVDQKVDATSGRRRGCPSRRGTGSRRGCWAAGRCGGWRRCDCRRHIPIPNTRQFGDCRQGCAGDACCVVQVDP